MSLSKKAPWAAIGIALSGALMLTACSPGSLGSSSGSSNTGGSGNVTISLLCDNSDQTLKPIQAAADAFNATNQGVTVKVETRPQGTDGDNLVKTKLATGEMTEIFQYNSGSLLMALDPAKNVVPLTNEPFADKLDDAFKQSVTQDGQLYGVPFGQVTGGGILYNRTVYKDLGLQTPKTWAEFMANNAKIKESGIDPVLQSYGDTWTSQLFVLADFHNVTAKQADWAEKYTKNQAKYSEEPAIEGFKRLEEIHKSGFVNKDFASLKMNQALDRLVKGKAAHYPILTFAVAAYVPMAPDAAENIGFFAMPGDDAASYGLTAWSPAGLYISSSAKGEKLDAAKKFFTWWSTPEACDVQTKAVAPTGPYAIKGCKLPENLPTTVKDLQALTDAGTSSPALEFLSPVKGPNLEKITVEVGSGITSAVDGAKRYDEDVKKQAQQLGLPGW